MLLTAFTIKANLFLFVKSFLKLLGIFKKFAAAVDQRGKDLTVQLFVFFFFSKLTCPARLSPSSAFSLYKVTFRCLKVFCLLMELTKTRSFVKWIFKRSITTTRYSLAKKDRNVKPLFLFFQKWFWKGVLALLWKQAFLFPYISSVYNLQIFVKRDFPDEKILNLSFLCNFAHTI